MTGIEREYTFLVNELPGNLGDFPSIIVSDSYVPASEEHPILRIRRRGDKCEITKKYPADSKDGGISGDSSRQVEHTIPLLGAEYDVLDACEGKRLKKRRFFYEADGVKSDIDVFLGDLIGLATADFEFESEEEMLVFEAPSFVGADVSQELMIAGGILCGKSYVDIGGVLKEKYGYEPVIGAEKYEEEKL